MDFSTLPGGVFLKLQTIRVRRSRPSAPALALALALTMLFVYLISLSAGTEAPESDAAAAAASGEAAVRMEGLEAAFICDAVCDDLTEARVAAANCAANGGAGMLLRENAQFAVVREAVNSDAAPQDALRRSASGLTLKLSGPAAEVAAVSDAVAFLRAQAAETGSLAAALESGGTDANSIVALMEVYRTQGARARSALEKVSNQGETIQRLQSAVQGELDRLDSAIQSPDAGKIKLIHAAACGEWISLLNALSESA